MKKTALIDWIAATIPTRFETPQTLANYLEGIFPTPSDTYILSKPLHGYKVAIIEPLGIMCMTAGTEKMGAHVVLSGSTLNNLSSAGFPREKALENLINIGSRFSRIDLAIDVRDGHIKPKQLYAALEQGSATTKARNYRIIEDGRLGGQTLYLGSPTSEKMIRMYDKAAEQRQSGDWLRVESQLTGSLADRAAKAVLAHGIGAVATGVIDDFVQWDERGWNEIISGEIAGIESSTRKITNTKRWLLDIVSKSIADVTMTDSDFPQELWERVTEELRRMELRKLK